MATEPDVRNAGRIVGGLFIVQSILGYVANFTLLERVVAPPGFLANAAPNATSVAAAALLGVVIGGMSLGIAIACYPVFRRQSQALALWFVGVSVAGMAAAVLESSALMSLVSLSESYTTAGPSQQPQFELMRGVVASSRNWAHYIHLIVSGAALFVFFLAALRFALVPRALAALGLLAAMLQIYAVSTPLFGGSVVFALLAPLGISLLLAAVWLIAKGFPSGR